MMRFYRYLFLILLLLFPMKNVVAGIVVVNHQMDFGEIALMGKLSTVKLNGRGDISIIGESLILNPSMVSPALIHITGLSEEEVEVTFIASSLIGEKGTIPLENIIVRERSNTFKLDKGGNKSVEIIADLSINNPKLIGKHIGKFEVVVNFKGSKISISKSIEARINISNPFEKVNFVQQIDFGEVHVDSKKACSISVGVSGGYSSTCDSVSGAVFPAEIVISSYGDVLGARYLPKSGIVFLNSKKSSCITCKLSVTNIQVMVTKIREYEYLLKIGGTLNIPINAQLGEYEGTFEVMVDY